MIQATDPAMDTLVSALNDGTRRRVIELLQEGPRRPGELSALTQVPAPIMSRHLRILLEAGIVDDERSAADARVRLFFLRKEALMGLLEWLQDIEFWGATQQAPTVEPGE